MFRIFCLITGYAIGCVQIPYIIGRLTGRIDIRDHGSGNAGTTNVARVLGMKAGLTVFVGDVLKGAACYVLCAVLFDGGGSFFTGANGLLPGLYGGLGVVIGHDFPLFMGLRGGKGIASTLGVVACTDWRLALIDFVGGFSVLCVSRIISVTSLFMMALFPVLLGLFGYPPEAVVLAAILAAIAFERHRGNIGRLIRGEEKKFVFRKGRS